MGFTRKQLQDMRQIAERLTPKDTGTLVNSLILLPSPFGVILSYNTSYAKYVRRKGEDEWFGDKIYEEINKYISRIRRKASGEVEDRLESGLFVDVKAGKSKRKAVNNPNPLLHPDDPTTPKQVRERPKLKLKEPITTATMTSSGGGSIGNMVPPNSHQEPGTIERYTRGQIKAQESMWDLLDRRLVRTLLAYGAYRMITDPIRVNQLDKEIEEEERGDK